MINKQSLVTWVVVSVSILLNAWLIVACWDINPWPADAEVYYMPAARDLKDLTQISLMHQALDEERIKWLHGKEYHVLAIKAVQTLMADQESLRPLIVLGALCMAISSILLFLIGRALFGTLPALGGWVLFTFSFWPYLYVIFPKHQPQGMMLMLFAAWGMINAFNQSVTVYRFCWLWLTGIILGMALFSSTVSAVYLPLWLALAIWLFSPLFRVRAWGKIFLNGVVIFLGFMLAVVYANYPKVWHNIGAFISYVQISSQFNHFYYNQEVLAQWFPTHQMHLIHGGMIWVMKYLLLVIPLLLGAVLVGVWRYIWQYRQSMKAIAILLGWLLLGFSPIILAQIKGVAQYGANYFPTLVTLIFLLMFLYPQIRWCLSSTSRWGVFLIAYLGFNAFWWTVDVYPARMATTQISHWLQEQKIHQIATYPDHPLRRNFIDQLNPAIRQQLTVNPIATIMQAQVPVLLPPVSTDNVFLASNGDYTYFDQDLVLNNIITQGLLDKVAVKKFKTIASSVMWNMEEEIIAYRYLMLDQMRDPQSRYVYIIDPANLVRFWPQIAPQDTQIQFYQEGIRTIGNLTPINRYKGFQFFLESPRVLKGVSLRVAKKGQPLDGLRAYAFMPDPKQPHRIAAGKHFISKPLEASLITDNQAGEVMNMVFDPPINLPVGLNEIYFYRQGPEDNQHHYLIWNQSVTAILE